uniref:Polyhomeotic-like protein 2 n=1 Tax=Phallusia mammillata TaxID=59560 RepID=A0A6F9DPC1_9ASCI|nr:polyhomeotic-like protein 2 [Phallusia mammillata]
MDEADCPTIDSHWEPNDPTPSQMMNLNNGDSLANSPNKNKILTHIIDGFVIEESIVPFPLQVSCMLTTRQLNMIRKRQQEIMLRERENDETNSMWSVERDRSDALEVATATCEQCGFSGPKCRFTAPAHRFCSLGCARKFNSGCLTAPLSGNKMRRGTSSSGLRGRPRGSSVRTRMFRGRHPGPGRARRKSFGLSRPRIESSPSHSLSDSNSFTESENEADESDGSVFSCSPSLSPQPVVPFAGDEQVCPMLWSVDDVWKYIRSLPDSWQHANDFRNQEIDGSALLLLHEEHLVGSMNLPLGPALKLCAHIDKLRQIV